MGAAAILTISLHVVFHCQFTFFLIVAHTRRPSGAIVKKETNLTFS